MDFKISINALFPFLILLQGLLFATLLLLRGRREERYSDFWLAFLLFLEALSVIPFLLGWLGITFLWEKLTFLPWDGFGWAVAPTLYLFLKSLTNEQWRFSWRQDGVHFLPYLVIFFYHLIVGGYGLVNRDFVLNWWNNIEHQFFIADSLLVLGYVQSFFYYYLGWQLYKAYQEWTATQFSNLDKVSYQWFRNFLIFNALVTCAELANSIYLYFVAYGYDRMWLSYGANMVLTYYLSIAGFMQARIYGVRFVSQNEDTALETAALDTANAENTLQNNQEGAILVQNEEIALPTAPKNGLTEEELTLWKTKLSKLMQTQKPYLQPDLTLSDLAGLLKTNTSIVSQVINAGFSKNFNDFINGFRVDDYLEKVATPQYKHLTLLAVAFECGFNSKTTFNRAFKKIKGKAPSDF
jgi:AraC-like DNA-binding protein